MSATVDFYLVDERKIPALQRAYQPTVTRTWWGGKRMRYHALGRFLRDETQYLGCFAHSGWVYGEVFQYFDDVFNYRELELGKIADALGVTLFTYRDKEEIIKQLSPQNLKEEDLRFFAEEYYETPEQKNDCGKNLLEAIALLYESLQKINPSQVLMLSIGQL